MTSNNAPAGAAADCVSLKWMSMNASWFVAVLRGSVLELVVIGTRRCAQVVDLLPCLVVGRGEFVERDEDAGSHHRSGAFGSRTQSAERLRDRCDLGDDGLDHPCLEPNDVVLIRVELELNCARERFAIYSAVEQDQRI